MQQPKAWRTRFFLFFLFFLQSGCKKRKSGHRQAVENRVDLPGVQCYSTVSLVLVLESTNASRVWVGGGDETKIDLPRTATDFGYMYDVGL